MCLTCLVKHTQSSTDQTPTFVKSEVPTAVMKVPDCLSYGTITFSVCPQIVKVPNVKK